jgi:hypothetical protein
MQYFLTLLAQLDLNSVEPATIMTVQSLLFAGLGSVTAVVVMLWRKVEANHTEAKEELKDTRHKLNDCETDRVKLWEKLSFIEASKQNRDSIG